MILIESACVSLVARLSRTRTVKLQLPFFVGVPLMTPVEELSESPGGNAPDGSDQV